jgi:hypothetical protein
VVLDNAYRHGRFSLSAFGKQMIGGRPADGSRPAAIFDAAIPAVSVQVAPSIRSTTPIPNHPQTRDVFATLFKETKSRKSAFFNDHESHASSTLRNLGAMLRSENTTEINDFLLVSRGVLARSNQKTAN